MMYAKTDLHLHLDGSLPLKTIHYLAKIQKIELPAKDQLFYTVPPDCQSLAEYLKCFALPLRLLQTAEALTIATHDLLCELAEEGITYAEIRFAPQLHTKMGLTQSKAIEAILRAVKDQSAIQTGVILCMMTNGNEKENQLTTELAIKYQQDGVCALDLAGQEGAQPMHVFAPSFAQAVENGVHVTIHAGEACGAENVLAALDCGAQRIGHGTRAIENPEVVRRLVEQGITLEQCVTSNVQTHCAQGYWSHPIRQLFDAGVRIAICTDNRTVSGTTLAREYQILQTQMQFTNKECEVLAQYAKDAAFIKKSI